MQLARECVVDGVESFLRYAGARRWRLWASAKGGGFGGAIVGGAKALHGVSVRVQRQHWWLVLERICRINSF